MLKKLFSIGNITIILIILTLLLFDEVYANFAPIYIPDTTTPTGIYYLFLLGVPSIMMILSIILRIIISKKSSIPSVQLDFGAEGKSLPNINAINYCREIPCNKDPIRAYWIAFQYSVIPLKAIMPGIIAAILLKWIKHKFISVAKTNPESNNFKDNYFINLNEIRDTDTYNAIESELLGMLKKAVGGNGILEAEKFEIWCKKNYKKMEAWFDKLITYETSQLKQQGLITDSFKEIPGKFGKTKTITIKNVDPILKNEAIQIRGLRMFLLDSLIHKKEHFESHTQEEYSIFAHLLGIVDEVKQFSKLHPEFNQVSRLGTEFTDIAVSKIAYSGYQGMRAGRIITSNAVKKQPGDISVAAEGYWWKL
jgi:hypothetical protein